MAGGLPAKGAMASTGSLSARRHAARERRHLRSASASSLLRSWLRSDASAFVPISCKLLRNFRKAGAKRNIYLEGGGAIRTCPLQSVLPSGVGFKLNTSHQQDFQHKLSSFFCSPCSYRVFRALPPLLRKDPCSIPDTHKSRRDELTISISEIEPLRLARFQN